MEKKISDDQVIHINERLYKTCQTILEVAGEMRQMDDVTANIDADILEDVFNKVHAVRNLFWDRNEPEMARKAREEQEEKPRRSRCG